MYQTKVSLKSHQKKGPTAVFMCTDSIHVHASDSQRVSSQPAYPDVRSTWFTIHRVMIITPTSGDEQRLCMDLAEMWKPQVLLKQYTGWAHLWRRVLKWVMPASSATLITAELGRIVAVSSSNQTTSAAMLNGLITQLTLSWCTLK